jgi:hypothetical protein
MGGRFAAGRGGEEEREDGEGKARETLKGRETREGEREGRGREGKGHREGRDRKVGEGKGAGADGIAGGQNVSTPSIKYWLRHWVKLCCVIQFSAECTLLPDSNKTGRSA